MASNSATDPSRARLVERLAEAVFVLGVVAGMALLAAGFMITIVSFSMGTSPPSPYFANSSERYVALAVGVVTFIVGLLGLRQSFRFGGW